MRYTFIILLWLTCFASFAQTQQTSADNQQSSKSLVDTATLNAMKDSMSNRLGQVFDIDMLMQCLQVRQISSIGMVTLLTKNKSLADTVNKFEKDYGVNLMVHSYINSLQFWPNLLFNKDKLSDWTTNAQNKPGVGFDIKFTPKGSNWLDRTFKADIGNGATQGLLDTTKLNKVKVAENKTLGNSFASIPRDTINQAVFKGIDVLRDLFKEQSDQCNLSQVTFMPCSGQVYGFDVIPDNTLRSYYDQLNLKGRPYEVPWKSVATSSIDSVRIKIVKSDKSAPTHKVQFRSSVGSGLITKQNPDSTFTLTLNGRSNKDEEIIEAYYIDTLPTQKTKEFVIGKLKIKSYTPVTKKVIPVLLNGVSFTVNTAELKKALNNIYKQAATTWDVSDPVKVTVAKNDWDKDQDGILKIETSPLHRYSDEMQTIIDAVNKVVTPDPEAAYLVITDLGNNYSYEGYMPLKAECAFLFVKNSSQEQNVYHTAAHELGHGIFYLRHLEDEYKILAATHNLMDNHVGGNDLWKPQWDWIGDPSWRLYMFQKENEGAQTSLGLVALKDLKDIDKDKGDSYSFINPAGKIVSLPARATKVIFCNYDKYFSKVGDQIISTDDSSPIGCLIGFTLDEQSFDATKQVNNFVGYEYTPSTTETSDNTTKATDQVITKSDYNIKVLNNSYRYIDLLSFKKQITQGIALITTVENKQFVGYAAKFTPLNTEINEASDGKGVIQKSLFVVNTTFDDLKKTVTDYLSSKSDKTVKVTDIDYMPHTGYKIIKTTPEQSTEDYLKTNLSESSNLADVLVRFALIYQSPDAIAAIQPCNQDNMTHFLTLAQAETQQQFPNKQFIEEMAEKFLAVSSVSFNEIQSAKDLKALVDKAKYFSDIQNALQIYRSSCTLRALDITTRINILSWLINSDDPFWELYDKKIICELIRLAPSQQNVDLLKAFINNHTTEDDYTWLYAIYDKGSRKEAGEVIDVLTEQIIPNFSQLGIQPTQKEVYSINLGHFTSMKVPIVAYTYLMGATKGEMISIDQNYGLSFGSSDGLGSFEFLNTGEIKIKQFYSVYDTKPTYRLAGETSKLFDAALDFNVNPFESVTISTTRDCPEFNIKANTSTVVPAIYALRISEALIHQEHVERNIRIAFDALMIILAIPSDGESLTLTSFLATSGAAVALADIYMQANKKSFSASEIKAWDDFSRTVYAVQGAVGVCQLARLEALQTGWATFSSLVKNSSQTASSAFRNVWSSVNALRTSGAIAEIDYALLDELNALVNGSRNYKQFVQDNLQRLIKNPSAVWELGASPRGQIIEEIWRRTEYSKYVNLNDFKSNFKYLDFADGIEVSSSKVVSFKSFDQPANNTISSFESKLLDYTKALSNADLNELTNVLKNKAVNFPELLNANLVGKEKILHVIVKDGIWDINQLKQIGNTIMARPEYQGIKIIIGTF